MSQLQKLAPKYIENTSSLVCDFMQNKAVAKRNTKDEDTIPNPLNKKEQEQLIILILSKCYNIKMDGNKEILLDIGDGRVQHIERNYKNFQTILKMAFRDLTTEGGYETINLPKLFEIIKSRDSYTLRDSRSIFHEKNALVIDREKNELINKIKIDFDFGIDIIDREIYTEVVEAISQHWEGHITTILDHLVAGKFVSDKKNIWLLIMANSNFGKSKLFKWIEPFGGSAFIEFEDLTSSGISDKDPSEFEGKLCLVIDEVLNFHRKLFKIEDYLMVRPMRNHAIKVGINSRILLSADGGSFNNEYMDKQITNRVAQIDLRSPLSRELGELEITKKYQAYTIQKVMTHYLFEEITKRIDEYKSLSELDRVNKADKTIQEIFKKHKQVKKDFFEMTRDSLIEILRNPESALDEKHFNILAEALVNTGSEPFIRGKYTGVVVKRPKTIIPLILANYDKSLEYELKFKELSQIVENFEGAEQGSFSFNKQTSRGLFIPLEKCPF